MTDILYTGYQFITDEERAARNERESRELARARQLAAELAERAPATLEAITGELRNNFWAVDNQVKILTRELTALDDQAEYAEQRSIRCQE